ncbi:class I SAM-dependent methyltransferase [Nautilia lithotrophica]
MAEKYDNAEMNEFYNFISPYLKGKRLLDIGCGSGRDIGFYLQKGFEVVGIDPAVEFLKICKLKYQNLKFYNSSLPNLKLPVKNFDVIALTAVWMHIPRIFYTSSIKSLKRYLNKNGIVILSYSTNKREGFSYINPKFLQRKFLENGFVKMKENFSYDAMNRNIEWVTQIYAKIT